MLQPLRLSLEVRLLLLMQTRPSRGRATGTTPLTSLAWRTLQHRCVVYLPFFI